MNDFKNQTKNMLKTAWNDYSVMFVFIVIILLCSIVEKNFFTWTNLTAIFRSCSALGIIALGMTYIIISGGIDLSVGSTFACCGAVLLTIQGAGVPLPIAILGSCVFGIFIGFFNGFFIAKFALPPFIVTLATQTLLRSVVKYITNGTTVMGVQEPVFMSIGNGSLFGGIPIAFVIFLIVALIMHVVLSKTKFGTYVYALGGNEDAAWYSGVNVKLHKLIVFMISGTCAGIAGIVLLGRVGAAAPTAGTGYETYAIAASIIGGTSFMGGKGKIPGVVIGGLIIGLINYGMTALTIPSSYQKIVMGALIIISVAIDHFVATAKK